jgi:fatty acid desaturase
MNWLSKQWKSSPTRVAMGAIFLCVALVWAFGEFRQVKWVNWLFLPMFCVGGITVFIDIKTRKRRQIVRGIVSSVTLTMLAYRYLLLQSSPEYSKIPSWPSVVILASIVVSAVASYMLPED